MKLFFPAISITLLFVSCNSSPSPEALNSKKDSITKSNVVDSAFIEGIGGIIEIPEMLTLAIKDSGTTEQIPAKMGMAYNNIQEDIQNLNLEMQGAPGTLFYTNDPKNFVFECVMLIKSMPTKKPKYSQIVILEATRAVIYNYYGPYDKMYLAYEKLKPYMTENKLFQTGPSREFYITNAELQPDSAKWLSRIFIPVK